MIWERNGNKKKILGRCNLSIMGELSCTQPSCGWLQLLGAPAGFVNVQSGTDMQYLFGHGWVGLGL